MEDGEPVLKRQKRKSKGAKTKEKKPFRDEEYFLPYEPKGENVYEERGYAVRDRSRPQRLEDLVLDLVPEDNETMLRHRQITRWDARKKKYVKLQVQGDALPGATPLEKLRVRNESGVLQSGVRKTEAYEKWKQKTKFRIQKEGELEDTKAVNFAPGTRVGSKFRHHTRPKGDDSKDGGEVCAISILLISTLLWEGRGSRCPVA